jgi:hypothetical protein
VDRIDKIRWWQWLPFWRWRIVGQAEAADEVPSRLPRNGAVFIGSETYPKWLAFDCPCRSGHRIMIPLDKARRPHWRIVTSAPLSVHPSVDYTAKDRRCHYFIRQGRIKWAKNSWRTR